MRSTTHIRAAMIEDLTVGTLKLVNGAVTSGLEDVLSLTFPLSQPCIILLGWSYEAVNNAASGTVNGRIFLNATEMEFSRAQGVSGSSGNGSATTVSCMP